MKRMLATWKYRRRLHGQPESVRTHLSDPVLLRRLALAKTVVCTNPSLVYNPLPRVTDFFATQDQTEHTRHRVIQLCGSLASSSRAPHFLAIKQAARSLGVGLREIDVDSADSHHVTGRLDRMWYFLGDAEALGKEGFEPGVSLVALVQQINAKGGEALFLTQRQPKRILGICAYRYEARAEFLQARTLLEDMGISLELAAGADVQVEGAAINLPDDLDVALPEAVEMIRVARSVI